MDSSDLSISFCLTDENKEPLTGETVQMTPKSLVENYFNMLKPENIPVVEEPEKGLSRTQIILIAAAGILLVCGAAAVFFIVRHRKKRKQ